MGETTMDKEIHIWHSCYVPSLLIRQATAKLNYISVYELRLRLKTKDEEKKIQNELCKLNSHAKPR